MSGDGEIRGAETSPKDRDRAQEHFDLDASTFRLVVENAADGIVLVDRDGKPIYVNSAAATMFGRSRDQIAGLSLGHFATTSDMTQITIVRPTGPPAEVELRVVGMSWNDQTVYLANLRDISALRAKEERQRQFQKLEAVGQLAAGITHDFRNLIAAVQSGLRIIGNKVRDGAARPDIEALVEEVMKRTQSAEALTSQLLSFSRKQAAAVRIVDINQRIASVASMLAQTLGSGIAVRTGLADGVGTAEIDPSQFDMALLNLALNGKDAMGGHGTLTIEADLAADDALPGEQTAFIRVTVRDTGAGMAPEVKEKIFEPFFTTKGDGSGTGLGLIQVYGFVMRSGGHIKVDSDLGKGTAVHLFLPKRSGTDVPA